MELKINIDIVKARFALINDGYLKEDILQMSDEEVSMIWCNKFYIQILDNYYKGHALNLCNIDEELKYNG